MLLSGLDEEMLSGLHGDAVSLSMRILVQTGRMLGAHALIDIRSAHIDGCLYHGDSGALFAEKLVSFNAKVRVPTTLNVGALDLLHARNDRFDPAARDMARRMMSAYVAMGCQPTWTCAPYQAGHRPRLGEDVAWGESNAVAFCNSVLGARTNRYGDFLDICAAITGRVPQYGLHLISQRTATVLIDATQLSRAFLKDDIAYPILGAWLGAELGARVAAFKGLGSPSEDQLKALGAAAASTGAVGLFHVIGLTPEAATESQAFGGKHPAEIIIVDEAMLSSARAALSSIVLHPGDAISAVAIGSPHLSAPEIRALDAAVAGRRCQVPLYACTSRHSLSIVKREGLEDRLKSLGIIFVADTCIVVSPILPAGSGVLMTNSGKFAHYTPANTGYDVVFAGLRECVESAIAGTCQL